MDWSRQLLLILAAAAFAAWRLMSLVDGDHVARQAASAGFPRYEEIKSILITHLDMFQHTVVAGRSHREDPQAVVLFQPKSAAQPQIVAMITLSPSRVVERAAREQILEGELRHRLVFDRHSLLPVSGGADRYRHRADRGNSRPGAKRGFSALFSAIIGGGSVAGGVEGKPGGRSHTHEQTSPETAVLTVYPESYRTVCGSAINGDADPIDTAWNVSLGAPDQPSGSCGDLVRSIRRAARTAAATGVVVWEYAPLADVKAAGLVTTARPREARLNPFEPSGAKNRFAASHDLSPTKEPRTLEESIEVHADGATDKTQP